MKESVEIKSPAKINLSLLVKGRRFDGYHELESIMAAVGLADTITLRPSKEDGLIIGGPAAAQGDDGFAGGRNLAMRALKLFREATGYPRTGVQIYLDKHIPLGAGLGGGSSNAGVILATLNRLAGSESLGPDKLNRLALGLGADVPFFALGHCLALAKGVGEALTPIKSWPSWLEKPLILLNTGEKLKTAAVFENLGLTSGAFNIILSQLSDGADMWAHTGRNDLKAPAAKLSARLLDAEALLSSLRPIKAGLSGSGPTMWAFFESEADAQGAFTQLSEKALAWKVYKTRLLI